MLNEYFDKIVCITLKERTDKKEKIQARFEKFKVDVEWFEAVQYGFIPNIIEPIVSSKKGHFNKNQPYEIGAALSHYHVIKQALLEGVEKLFVFEDDALFQKDYNTNLPTYMNQVPGDWHMLMFYTFMYKILPQNVKIANRWIKSYKGWSAMAYGIKRDLMQAYIEMQDKLFSISDIPFFQMQEQDYKIYSAIPPLFIPDGNMGSNIRGTNMNYENTPSIINVGYGKDKYE